MYCIFVVYVVSDIDECIVNEPKPCDLSLCVNTLGSFYCNCATGFIKLNEDDTNCTDISKLILYYYLH